jgi:Zn-dependent protease
MLEPGIIALASGFVILIFSVILHEVMHGYVALKFGDRTALNAGRLTLNPISHIDPIGTILFPLLGAITGAGLFGWAKPVPVNPLHFSDLRKGELLVSAAGVLTNFALSIIFAILFHIEVALYPNVLISQILKTGVIINLILAIFNLIPIPPLDGSKVLMSFLPYEAAREYMKFERYGFLILILLIYMGVIGWIISFIIPFFFAILGMRVF